MGCNGLTAVLHRKLQPNTQLSNLWAIGSMRGLKPLSGLSYTPLLIFPPIFIYFHYRKGLERIQCCSFLR